MNRAIILVCSFLLSITAAGQNIGYQIGYQQTDSLRRVLEKAPNDTLRALAMNQLAEAYRGAKLDSTYYYANAALVLFRRIDNVAGESKALSSLCFYFQSTGNYPAGLEAGIKALSIARDNNLRYEQASAMIRIGNVYLNMNEFREAIRYYSETRELVKNTPDSFFYAVTYWVSADSYAKLKMADSALLMANLALDTATKMKSNSILRGLSRIYGDIYALKGEETKALQYYHAAMPTTYYELAEFYFNKKRTDSAISYGRLSYDFAESSNRKSISLKSSELLSKVYAGIDPKKSLQFLTRANSLRDSLFGIDKIKAVQLLEFGERERANDLEDARTRYRSNLQKIALITGMGIFLLVSLVLYRNNQQKNKANIALNAEKQKVEEAFQNLRKMQNQLVQSEKMASLGELTAGIAHEIQNPLNFVNNFSEVSTELIAEMKAELKKGKIEEAIDIADDIDSNLEKINHHGKRADAIVKGMLQHSRTSSGQKEPTDINALADEYLRLAYHGLKAKDKLFNVTMETDFNHAIGKVNIIPQDIGRVLLNIYNNAFYAVTERKHTDEAGYEPKVIISTKKQLNPQSDICNPQFIEIRVKDNGYGIPASVKEKIFQPFFTTKPTGQGTGLGLSLSYDIVKAHGGELRVETREVEGTEFVIQLPV